MRYALSPPPSNSYSGLFNKWHLDIPQSAEDTLASHPSVRQIVFQIVSGRDLLHPCFLLSQFEKNRQTHSHTLSRSLTNKHPHRCCSVNTNTHACCLAFRNGPTRSQPNTSQSTQMYTCPFGRT